MSFSTAKKWRDKFGDQLVNGWWYALGLPGCKTRKERVRYGEDEVGDPFLFYPRQDNCVRLDEVDSRAVLTPLDKHGNEIEREPSDDCSESAERERLVGALDRIADAAAKHRAALAILEEEACELIGCKAQGCSDLADEVLRFVWNGESSSERLLAMVDRARKATRLESTENEPRRRSGR